MKPSSWPYCASLSAPFAVDPSPLELKKEKPASLGGSDAPSELSPGKCIVDPSPLSPVEDLRVYYEQLIQMAKSLHIEVICSEPTTFNPILKVLYLPNMGLTAFPMLQGLMNMSKSIWTKLASVSPAAKKIEHMFKVLGDYCDFLFAHPPSNCTGTEVIQAKQCSGPHSSSLD